MKTNLCIGDVLIDAQGRSFVVTARHDRRDGSASTYLIRAYDNGRRRAELPKYLFQYRVVCQHDGTNHGWGR